MLLSLAELVSRIGLSPARRPLLLDALYLSFSLPLSSLTFPSLRIVPNPAEKGSGCRGRKEETELSDGPKLGDLVAIAVDDLFVYGNYLKFPFDILLGGSAGLYSTAISSVSRLCRWQMEMFR